MKHSRSRTAGAVLGMALACVLGAAGAAGAQQQPSAPAPAGGTAATGTASVQAPAAVVDEVRAATARQRALAPNARVVCYAAHVQDVGWQSTVCDGGVRGPSGRAAGWRPR
ncbi:hypothetical protein AB0D94_22065 [Streptomyces sp. NPDC048255]|uniref:hypothetical protein n=1 Tax=Streptomyces sp. NPDC048255 TaxID=3154713 RepID=UPI0034103A76